MADLSGPTQYGTGSAGAQPQLLSGAPSSASQQYADTVNQQGQGAQGTTSSQSQTQNQSNSNSSSYSTPNAIQTSQSNLEEQIAAAAQALSAQQYTWAQQQYANTSNLTDANINNYLTNASMATGLAANNIDRYENIFQPQENTLAQEAGTYSSAPRTAFNMGAAESATGQALNQGRINAEDTLQSFGIDPSAGRYQELERAQQAGAAAAKAGAGQEAKLATATTGRQLLQSSIAVGQQYPGQTVNALNSAYQGIAGAENSGLSNVNTGVAAQGPAATSLNTAMQLKYPSIGNTSGSQSQSSSTGTSNSSSYGQHTGNTTGNTTGTAPGTNQPLLSGGGGGGNGGTSNTGNGSGGGGSGSGTGANTGAGSTGNVFNTGTGAIPDPRISGSGGNAATTGNTSTGDSTTGTMSSTGNSDSSGLPTSGSSGTDVFNTGTSGISNSDITGTGSGAASAGNSGGGYPIDITSYNTAAGAAAAAGNNGGSYGGGFYAKGGVIPAPTTGGQVPFQASPSMGQQTDDVPANLNAGEFVIPRDVAAWKGHEFFQKLIAQSRKARVTAPAHGKPGSTPQGPPSFASRPVGGGAPNRMGGIQ